MNNEQNTAVMQSQPQPKKKTHWFLKFLLFLLVLVLIVVAFFIGLLIGGRYGVSIDGINIDTLPFTQTIVEQLRKTTKMDYDITVTEAQINALAQTYEGNFAPLRNIYIQTGDGMLTLSGQINTAELSSMPGINVPELVLIFLPEILNIKAEAAVSVNDGAFEMVIDRIVLLNSEEGNEILSISGFDSAIVQIAKDMIESNIPEGLTIDSLSVTEKGLRVSGSAALIKKAE